MEKSIKSAEVMNVLKRYCIVLALCFIASCTDENADVKPKFDSNLTFTIENVTASTISLNNSLTFSHTLQYGIRKVGTQEFKAYGSSQDITGLEPAQEYEITIIMLDSKELPFEIKKFTTTPFDYIEKQNSLYSNFYYYSEQTFIHELTPNIPTDLSNTKLFWVSTTDITRRFELLYSINDGKIVFTSPEGSILTKPFYEEYHVYYLAYQINNSEIKPLIQDIFGSFREAFFVVFNTTPQFTDTVYVKNSLCQGNKMYELYFRGHFFSSFIDYPYYYPKSTAIITRLDDESEIIIEEENQIQQTCFSFRRLWTKELVEDSPGGLFKVHSNSFVNIEMLETTLGNTNFTTGDYKIKLTFSNGQDDFFETNEYQFTIE